MNSYPTNIEFSVEDTPALLRETEALRDLRVLDAIEADSSVSQRELARELGVAVGVVNALVRSLVRKGMIKVRGENNRSVTYHLTKAGLLHKSALAVQWTRNTIGFYRQARSQVAGHLRDYVAHGHTRAIIFGAAELAEIAVLVAPESGIEITGIIADGATPLGERIGGFEVRQLARLGVDELGADIIVLSESATSDQLRSIAQRFPALEVVSLLGLSTEPEEVDS